MADLFTQHEPRIGADANGLDYSGDSLAIDANGVLLADLGDEATSHTVTLDAAQLLAYREAFPAHRDADGFRLDQET